MKYFYECSCSETLRCRLELDAKLPIKHPPACPFDGSDAEWKIVNSNKETSAAGPENVVLDDCDNAPGLKSTLPDWCSIGKMVFNYHSNAFEVIENITDKMIYTKGEKTGDNVSFTKVNEYLTPATLIPWTFETGPDVFIDDQKKKWAKCVNYDSTTEDVEWGYFKVNDKCWASFEYVMQNHKQLDGSACGIWVKQEAGKSVWELIAEGAKEAARITYLRNKDLPKCPHCGSANVRKSGPDGYCNECCRCSSGLFAGLKKNRSESKMEESETQILMKMIQKLSNRSTKLYNLLDSYRADWKEEWEIKRQELLNKIDKEEIEVNPASRERVG